RLGSGFNIWGVESEKLTNYTPVNVDVVEIAARYIRQMKIIQPHGPYYLAAWSWGGHVILEMALQLERIGETLSLLAFFDCPGPDYKQGREPLEFNLESEKEFLNNFFSTTRYREELEKPDDIQQLWVWVAGVLAADPALVEELRQMMIANAMALPNYDRLTGEELIQYLNIDRIHRDAGFQYVPQGKIHTIIHYFWANQNPERVDNWGDHCHNPIVYHELNADHHSILRNEEHIAQFAAKFKDLLNKISKS
ncbi:MAG: hypothetical protein GY940_28350, partial [bacterium]|nr:hypothetical protein [bacterium]